MKSQCICVWFASCLKKKKERETKNTKHQKTTVNYAFIQLRFFMFLLFFSPPILF